MQPWCAERASRADAGSGHLAEHLPEKLTEHFDGVSCGVEKAN